jgi:hypothetical protein
MMCAYCGFQFVSPGAATAPDPWYRRWRRRLLPGAALPVLLATIIASVMYLLR